MVLWFYDFANIERKYLISDLVNIALLGYLNRRIDIKNSKIVYYKIRVK